MKTGIIVVFVLGLMAPSVRAQINGFGTNGTGWTLNGGPTIVSDVLTLTDDGGAEASSAWFSIPQTNNSFTASFIYQASGSLQADGVTFVLQNVGLTALGTVGGGLGYCGIGASVAFEINIYSDASGGRGTSFDTNGVTADCSGGTPYTSTAPVNLASGDPISVTVTYTGNLLNETLFDLVTSDSFTTNYTVNISTAVGGGTAYVGFTGGTGGLTSIQTISNFMYQSSVNLMNSWIGSANGKWEVPENWSLGAPTNAEILVISNAPSTTVTIDATTTTGFSSNMSVAELVLSAPSGVTNTVFMNSAGLATPLTLQNNFDVESNGAVVVNQSVVQSSGFYLGNTGGNNSLVISNGGAVFSNSGTLGATGSSSNNTVLVTGSGSVWSNANYLYVGYSGDFNSLTIASGGTVYDNSGILGYQPGSDNNTVLVTGSGSVWSNSGNLYVGYVSGSSSLTVAGGAMAVSSLLSIGYTSNTTGTVWVTGGQLVMTNIGIAVGDNGGNGQLIVSNGSVVAWVMNVGVWPGADGTLTVAGGTVSVSAGIYVGGNEGSGTGAVWMTGGELVATNVETDVGYLGVGNMTVSNGTALLGNLCVGLLSSGSGSMTMAGGMVSVNQLVLTNGTGSVFTFNAGTLVSSGTSVTNSQLFVVGDGTDPATFQLNGGVHSFANNLEIASNAFLTGCGTVEGNVTIDPGGTVLANCGGTLTFSGMVTNNGTMLAVNNTVLQADGQVVNNGLIIATNGTAQFLGGLVNNGVVLTNGTVMTSNNYQISRIVRLNLPLLSNNILVQIPSVTNATYQLQVTPSLKPATWTNLGASQSGSGGVLSFTDSNGATNSPGRFYRIDVTVP
jgi:T5SS/PEP-CTERM-associated repeat protein